MSQPIRNLSEMTPNEVMDIQTKWLIAIEGHLKSIRGMLQFFVVLTILSMILGGCSVLLAL